jgi:hypothetical protein
MRKRFALFFTPVVLLLALMLPATTAASTLGSIRITDSWCTGGKIHVTFQVVKNAGHYATRFTLRATGQGNPGGTNRWYSGGSKNYSYTIFDNYARAYFSKTLTFNSSYYYSRIQGVARFYDGSTLIGTANITSGYCPAN